MRITITLILAAVVCLAANGLYAAHSDYGCHNCHVPHKAGSDDPSDYGVPLWSSAQNSDGLPTFTLYSSIKFDALETDIGQPDGASKLCLGCHDGSYSFWSQPYATDNALFDPGDLASSHPVSFTYDTALSAKVPNDGLRDPSSAMSGLGGTIAQDLLDDQSKMQCSSCHDVHLTGLTEYMLKYEYDTETHTDNVICRVCHNK